MNPKMALQFTILGCGSSGGVPRPALGWGDCDPKNPKNRRRRTSLLVERRPPSDPSPQAGEGVTRVLVDTSPGDVFNSGSTGFNVQDQAASIAQASNSSQALSGVACLDAYNCFAGGAIFSLSRGSPAVETDPLAKSYW